MKTIVRKVSVLAVLFSGLFLLTELVATIVFGTKHNSSILFTVQIAELFVLVVLLATKKIQVY